jgi:hypothetical protein
MATSWSIRSRHRRRVDDGHGVAGGRCGDVADVSAVRPDKPLADVQDHRRERLTHLVEHAQDDTGVVAQRVAAAQGSRWRAPASRSLGRGPGSAGRAGGRADAAPGSHAADCPAALSLELAGEPTGGNNHQPQPQSEPPSSLAVQRRSPTTPHWGWATLLEHPRPPAEVTYHPPPLVNCGRSSMGSNEEDSGGRLILPNAPGRK